MIGVLSAMGRHASIILTAAIGLAIVLPDVSAPLLPFLPAIVVALLALAMVRIDLADVLGHLRRPLRLATVLAGLMILTPLAVHLLATLLNVPPALHAGLILVACAPPLASSPNLALLLGLDAALTLNIMVVGTLVTPFIAPFLVSQLLGLAMDLEVWPLFLRLVGAVGAAVVIAGAARALFGKDRIAARSDLVNGLVVLAMLLFIVTVMGSVGAVLLDDPWRIARLLGVVMALNLGLQLAVGAGLTLIGTGRPAWSLSVGLMSGNRNFSIFFAALPADAASSLLLFLALYQVPIYVTPLLAGPFYRLMLRRRGAL